MSITSQPLPGAVAVEEQRGPHLCIPRRLDRYSGTAPKEKTKPTRPVAAAGSPPRARP